MRGLISVRLGSTGHDILLRNFNTTRKGSAVRKVSREIPNCFIGVCRALWSLSHHHHSGFRYSLEENNQFEDYIVLKNGKRLHMPNRMRLGTAKDGARIAWWEGFSGETKTGYKYDAYGELITRDGKSYYSEIVTGGKHGKDFKGNA